MKNSRTAPYHPMRDGLVERMNRSLLNLFRSHIDREEDWEEHLQLLLFLYRTTKHATTGLSPYEILFGFNPPSLLTPSLPSAVTPEPTEYSARLKCKLLELREMVDANIVESAERQRQSYRGSETRVKLRSGQQVLLNNPTKGKLDPRWTGPWTISDLKGPSTVLLRMGTTKCAVHINRVRPFLAEESGEQQVSTDWTPPLFHQEEDLTPPPSNDSQSGSPTDRVAPPTSGSSEEAQGQPQGRVDPSRNS